MLSKKTLASLFKPTFLVMPCATEGANALSTKKVEEKVENNNLELMTKYLNTELDCQRDTPQAKLKRNIEARKLIQKQVEERLRRIQEREEQERQKQLEKQKQYDTELIFTYYTDLPEENGGYTVTCTGKKLQYGVLASNVWKLGTQFETEDGQVFTVADKGGNNFNVWNRVDCYIPRQQGESISQYKKRVLNMGKQIKKVRVIKKER